MLTDDQIIDDQPDGRVHDILVRLTQEVARLTFENDALRAECVRTANDLIAAEHERDEAEDEISLLRTALAHYRHCPHAIPDCYCCEVARSALGDAG